MSESEEQAIRKRPRGVLALMDGSLPFYPFGAKLLHQSTRSMQRRTKMQENIHSSPKSLSLEVDFTLVFMADAHNQNSLRFRPLLVDFVQCHSGTCQVVCIPNHEHNQDLLCGGTGFFCLPWNHENRSVIIRLLSACEVPCVIVIDTKTGRRITDHGMVAIEYNDAQDVLERWKRGESGLTMAQSVGCTIS